MRVSNDNLDRVREILPADQAERLHPGCETWAVERAETGAGRMTVWPETAVGAVSWGGDSFWGRWDAGRAVLLLDAEIDAHPLVVDETGRLWVLLSAEDFHAWLAANLPAEGRDEVLRHLAAGGAPEAFSLAVGCSRLPIFRAREMVQVLLDARGGGEEAGAEPTCH